MNINFPNSRDLQNDSNLIVGNHDSVSRMTKVTSEYSLDISGRDKDINSFGVQELKSFDDVKTKASLKDVSLENNALAVMSNSMSGEDFSKLQKDGFSPEDITPEETVTNLDKIKATLALSGVSIPGYTDDISKEALEKIAGSEGYAVAIENALKENQLPMSKDNVESITEVLKQAESVELPSDEAKKFMLNNGLEPTVNNLYMANHSSSDVNFTGKAGYYKDSTGYVGKNPTELNFEDLRPQIEKIIEDAGLEVNEETLTEAKWLLEKNLPLTNENILRLQDINSISFPIEADMVARSSAASISDGFSAKSASINNTESSITKAVNMIQEVTKELDRREALLNNDNGDISSRRLLEETRLHLTIEASVSMQKKGIEVDTTDLQKLVENLKQAEKEVLSPLLMEEKYSEIPSDRVKTYEDELFVKIDLFRQTNKALENIKDAPEELAGKLAQEYARGESQTLETLSNSALKLKSDYDKAAKSYETLMTAPRADMGDSIKKAFRNVDDILSDMDMEVNRLNEKAVRILGYSEMEVTEENIENVIKAEVAVENLISKMTPSKVLNMIKEGENPLDKDIYELSNELVNDEISDNSKYSEFLFKLDRAGEITESERTAFIGIYRLINKIEKSDGKLVGDVIKADEKLTLANIISASRSDRKIGTDIKVDDSFGALERLVTYGESITDQILKGFSNRQSDSEYAKAESNAVKEMINKEEAVLDALENLNEALSPINMSAMDSLINMRGSLYRGLKNQLDRDEDLSDFDESVLKLQDSFEDEESVKEAFESFAKKAEEIVKDKTENADTYIDIKSLKLINKQLTIVRDMADSRIYEVPAYINGELTSINLKLVSDSENSGKINVSFETEFTGKVSSEFTLKNGNVSGFIATENRYFESIAKEREDGYRNELSNAGVNVSSMYYSSSRSLSIKGNYLESSDNNTPTTKQLYTVAKAIIKAIQK